MDYLKLTIEKIENVTTEKELSALEFVINMPQTNWSEGDKMIINARIKDVREFWALLV